MSAACEAAAQELGNGVAAALRAVDCVAGETTAAAFGRLFAPGGALLTVLTILLTLYVAFFAINLLLGRASLGVRSLTPRMMTLGLVLTFVTSWVAYSTVVWNLAIGGPDWIASILTGSRESATQVFAQKIDVVFQALQQASPGQAEGKDFGAFSPEGMMWLGAMLFMLGTVGVLVTARIALAVLVAVGPIFVVLALFSGTRGLFTGWLKGLVLLALVPLFAVLGGSVMLELAVPVLAALVQTPGHVDPQPAMAFFMIGAVHVALMILVLKVSGTMVSGWRVFGLVPEAGEQRPKASILPSTSISSSAGGRVVTAQRPLVRFEPPHPLPSIPFARAANDRGLVEVGRLAPSMPAREIVWAGTGIGEFATTAALRMRGIGSRYRPTEPRSTDRRRKS
jgi:type IV secretion system protein VirB6